MNQEKNHWLALYLSGQYPGHYKHPNRFEVILKIREMDSRNFSDTMLSLLKDKGDTEFYYTLLSSFESLHSPDYNKLLERLEIPSEVRFDPYLREKKEGQEIKTKSIGFLTPWDNNRKTKEEMINNILPSGWTFKSFDLKAFTDKGFLWNQIKEFLEEHAFYIVDLRPKQDQEEEKYNANVLLELGYIFAKKKLLILIKREGLKLPSDLNGIPYVEEKMIPASEVKKSHKNHLQDELKKEIAKAIAEFQ